MKEGNGPTRGHVWRQVAKWNRCRHLTITVKRVRTSRNVSEPRGGADVAFHRMDPCCVPGSPHRSRHMRTWICDSSPPSHTTNGPMVQPRSAARRLPRDRLKTPGPMRRGLRNDDGIGRESRGVSRQRATRKSFTVTGSSPKCVHQAVSSGCHSSSCSSPANGRRGGRGVVEVTAMSIPLKTRLEVSRGYFPTTFMCAVFLPAHAHARLRTRKA